MTVLLRNPYVLAALAATAAITGFGRAKRTAQAAVDDFAAAIEADNYLIGENARAHAQHTLEMEGAYDAAAQYGLSLEMVTDAALGDVAAHDSLHEALTRHFQQVEPGIDLTLAQELAYSQLVAMLGDVPHALAEAGEAARRNAEIQGGAALASHNLAAALGETVGAAGNVDYAAPLLTPTIGDVEAALADVEDVEDDDGTADVAVLTPKRRRDVGRLPAELEHAA